ncbi:unnamed protein product [Leuciscus chuanchicus]
MHEKEREQEDQPLSDQMKQYDLHKNHLLTDGTALCLPTRQSMFPHNRYGCLPSEQHIQEKREGSPEGYNVIAISKFTFASVYNHLRSGQSLLSAAKDKLYASDLSLSDTCLIIPAICQRGIEGPISLAMSVKSLKAHQSLLVHPSWQAFPHSICLNCRAEKLPREDKVRKSTSGCEERQAVPPVFLRTWTIVRS